MKYNLQLEEDRKAFRAATHMMVYEGKTVELSSVEDKKRTSAQNRALHLYFTQLAEALNNAGLDMRRTLRPDVDIPWNSETVKEHLWRPIQKAELQKESTTKLSTKDIDAVYDTLNRHLGEKFDISVSFPSIEGMLLNRRVQ
jgi:hypothetical protein